MEEINETIPGFLIPIVWPKVRNAPRVEKAIHRIGKLIRIRFVGSGKTEYFLSLILLVSIPYTVGVWIWEQFLSWLIAATLIVYLLYLIANNS